MYKGHKDMGKPACTYDVSGVPMPVILLHMVAWMLLGRKDFQVSGTKFDIKIAECKEEQQIEDVLQRGSDSKLGLFKFGIARNELQPTTRTPIFNM